MNTEMPAEVIYSRNYNFSYKIYTTY